MSILQTHSCHSSYNRLKYVFNEPAHSYQKTDKRVLAATGFNIKMLHDNDGRISVTQNGAYLERQFRTVLKRAHNPKRRYQAQTIIISFDPSEFDTSDLKAQSQQALQLVQHYVRKHFADCQSAIAIQSDGEGGKLHAHVVMNTIRPSGKTVATNRFNIQKLRKDFDEEMQTNYQKVTGRQWTNPIHNQSNRQDIHNLTTKSEWQQQLKELINQIKVKVTNITDFLHQLEQRGVTVTERQKGKSWTYHQVVNTKDGVKELKVRDFYQRVDKQTGEIKSTRGIGQSFSKSEIEHYFNKKKEKENQNYDRRENNGLEKVKTMAADAKVRIQRQRRINQIAQQRLEKATHDEERKAAKQKARLSNQEQRQTRGTKRVSRQATKSKREGRSKQPRRSKEIEGPER
ncbi:relaxase/mobilization nuclease domain-containing protein [Limosilactobacillus reuteri]|nr:relaxase/mobilization nuclease domain-containing protein [Limosilactobacillus reuteri]PEG88641.1 mobilization protein [Lactobacillus sp. UMNPBX13]PEH01205.1 mobilization protein [Lactobacillus sp. UMNPBX7]AEI56992.1 relaxase/mobilization nuclease domain protein [Limosilactobacillus reuteri SD2112]MCC4452205.1 relaxase/mobilization nuclease domain-containing protein [Limosilactobacillus reuteri]UIN25639.1 relaxase/mobilization nuclease domain-containing protein [Limosilactobacillus reuteri]